VSVPAVRKGKLELLLKTDLFKAHLPSYLCAERPFIAVFFDFIILPCILGLSVHARPFWPHT
jgi:hypothetical protein